MQEERREESPKPWRAGFLLLMVGLGLAVILADKLLEWLMPNR